MSVLVDVALAALAVAGLWAGATQFVAGGSRLARRLGISGLVVGLTVVAFGTSAPEFAVTLDAALAARPDISVGNVVGSNVVNLGFVLGGVALVRALRSSPALVRRDAVVLVAATAAVLVLLSDLVVSRVDGALLLAGLLAYLVALARTRSDRVAVTADPATRPARDAVRAVGGLGVVVASAHVLVLAAADLARVAGLSEWLVGVTVVAAGTSTPEFATSVVAARRGRSGLSAGNLVGSCLFNLLGVLGAAAVVRPLPVAGAAVDATAWLLGTTVVVAVMFWSRDVLSRVEGAVLVALNLLNWLSDLLG